MSNNNYEFNILHEAVASDDQFPDKTHDKVADTLFEVIKNSDRGVTIGLEGGWGSGKSTVVNFLRRRLAAEGNGTLVYLFDAWAHEGDPLRRIFLEGLIGEIDPEGGDEHLQMLIGEISGRKKIVKVNAKKSTSKLGAWISLSAILVPVGAAILSTIEFENLHWFSSDRDMHMPFWIGLVLSLSPFIALLLWRIFGDDKKTKNQEKKKRWSIKGNRVWDIFSSDVTEDYTQDITEDGERTSIEFERYFKEVLAHSIGKKKRYSRTLIVVDNLDRVEAEQALAIWSVLQTFFQHRSNYPSDEAVWSTNLWFLVPFDRDGLSKVWSRLNQSITVHQPEELTIKPLESQKQEIRSNELAPSFLEKCFQLIAEVPEPVMSAWVEYCDRCIRQSLTGWGDDELVEIIDTFKRFESRLDSSPTPRQIHTFVNRVGLLGMRWGGEMAAEAIALYALLRKDRSDRQLRKELLLPNLPTGYEGNRTPEELKRQLAGMLFGVDADKGIQLLLEPEIRSALTAGDSEAIQALIEEQKEAFWVAWKSIGSSYMPNGHVEEHRIAVTVAFCKGIIGHESRVAADISRLVSEWKKQDANWDLGQYDYSEALSSLFAVTKKPKELADWLNITVNKQLKDIINDIGGEDFQAKRLVHLNNLADILDIQKSPLKIKRYAALVDSKWLALLDALESEEIEMPYVLPTKQTIETLLTQVDVTNPSPQIISTLKTTLGISPRDGIWAIVADKIIQWGQNPNRNIGNDLGYDLMLYLFLKGESSIAKKIRECVDQPGFSSRVEQEIIDNAPALAALCAAVYREKLQSSSLGPVPKSYWQSTLDQKKHKPVFDLLSGYESLELTWELAREPQNELAIGFVQSEISNSAYGSSLAALYIDKYSWASEDQILEIISKLIEFGGLEKSRSKLVDAPVEYSGCLLLIRTHGGSLGESIVAEALSKVSIEEWKGALKADMSLFRCIDKKGDHNFKDAIQELTFQQLAEGELTDHIWNNFSEIYDVLMDKDDVVKNLTIKYFQLEEDPMSSDIFLNFSSYAKKFISGISNDDLMTRVEYWLVHSNRERLSWLVATGVGFSGETRESLRSRLIEMIRASDGEDKKIFSSVSDIFNIEISSLDEGEDGEENEDAGEKGAGNDGV